MNIEKDHLCEDCGKPTGRHHSAKLCFNCLKIREHKNQKRYAKSMKEQKSK